MGLIPGSGRSPWNGNPLQYSCWRIAWTEVPGGLQCRGSQSRARLKWLSTMHRFSYRHRFDPCFLLRVYGFPVTHLGWASWNPPPWPWISVTLNFSHKLEWNRPLNIWVQPALSLGYAIKSLGLAFFQIGQLGLQTINFPRVPQGNSPQTLNLGSQVCLCKTINLFWSKRCKCLITLSSFIIK